ncbi:hypothetical protein [Desulfosarcina ovata]|uniref:Uncharacterized protein n=1 Tax=Desulfosarcina ovata subsp. ovata TaxID=2752305 RepID=A0A5K8AGZ3_9BACT|nr:hypothetical protein [Desulfosarcina ovata]BBO91130.1 hypothetical protein DSCOOX_43100 [Desulfosarcina ovata subsp. ovata]
MVTAYNMKVAQMPFEERFQLPKPTAPANPFHAHRDTITRYRKEVDFIRSLQPGW